MGCQSRVDGDLQTVSGAVVIHGIAPDNPVMRPRRNHERFSTRLRHFAATLILSVGVSTATYAESIVSNGVEFSDEFGGLRLISAAGAGTRDDPFVVIEEYTGPGSAVLVIRGLNSLFGTATGALRPVGLVMRKIVKNATAKRWQEFDLELREQFDIPSDYFDGLSFDQMKTMDFPVNADMFAHVRFIMEPFDNLRFSNGIVEPGQTVAFEIVITDASPQPTIFLVQRAPTHLSNHDASRPRTNDAGQTTVAHAVRVVPHWERWQ